MRLRSVPLATALLAASASAQVVPYGAASPPGFAGGLDSAGRIPVAGNAAFVLRITGAPNPFLGLVLLGAAPTSIPVLGVTLLVDPTGAAILTVPAPATSLVVPIPPDPFFVGATAYAQFGVIDPALPNAIGLTNGVSITIAPDPTPARGYFGIQDFSAGANAPGQLAVLDLGISPPAFHSTGNLGFAGNIVNNFSPKVAFATETGMAFALGTDASNQFVRVFDLSADPGGVVAYPFVGDIPLGLPVNSIVGFRECEVTEDGALLFAVSGDSSGTVLLQVFDTSGLPTTVPATPVQTITLASVGSGPVSLDLSPDGSRLALLVGADVGAPVRLYGIVPGAPSPLAFQSNLALPGFAGLYDPSDLDFAPDGSLLFVSGGNGTFAVVDLTGPAPSTLISAGSWPATPPANLAAHGCAVGLLGGTLVGLVGDHPTAGGPLYSLIDLNETSLTFGQVLTSFSTNPGGNISNHRLHAGGRIVVATDGTGATVDCQMVDVIDLAFPDPITGFLATRVKVPTFATLTPAGLAGIPRDFDLR